MVELQSSPMDASSALCDIEVELQLKGRNPNIVISEISAELQRERQRNSELMERISVLESRLQQRDNESLLSGNNARGSRPGSNSGNRKRQKVEEVDERAEDGHVVMNLKEESAREEARFPNFDILKDGNVVADVEDTGYTVNDEEDIMRREGHPHDSEPLPIDVNTEASGKRVNDATSFQKDPCHKKPYKVAFCPKEVRKILDSEILLKKNAQSHTMRKIIAFASLGTRHGAEDLYELHFNHFTILRKGEPYLSPDDPGEHVLYENPGFQGKILYPNRENPTLCPVQILEEEKAMRPPDSSCPSCLFLCIKYGGSTRNLPQNEYVRQRMGRNKLKSFGPLMCRMSSLVNVRSGSFFFKALGITLLFMAGLSDDILRGETKYRSLDLLRKYYRTDEDAEGEQLFFEHFIPTRDAMHRYDRPLAKKAPSHKSKTNRQGADDKTRSVQDSSAKDFPSQFGVMGYSSNYHTEAAAVPSLKSLSEMPGRTSATPKPGTPSWISSGHGTSARPVNCLVPMMFWPPPNTYSAFPSGATHFHQFHAPPYPYCYYGYPPLPTPTPHSFTPETVHDKLATAVVSGEPDGHPGSSSSSS